MVERKQFNLMSAALILSGLEGLAVLAILLLTKSAEGGVFLGLSATRLALAAAVLAISAALLWLGFAWRKEGRLVQRIRQSTGKHAASLVLILAWGAILFLLLQSEGYYQIIFRPFKPLLSPELFPQLRPLLIWTCLILAQTAAGITLDHRDQFRKEPPQNHSLLVWLLLDLGSLMKESDQPRWQTLWQKHKASLLVFAGMVVVWIFIDATGIGIVPDDRYWNVAGVPVLWHQVIFTLLLVLFLLDLKRIAAGSKLVSISQKPAFAYILMALIWLAAVLVWQGETLNHTYFTVNTPPNYVTYPFSDAMSFDVGGQYFLMGEGLNNGNLTDRPYLMLQIALLHLLGGQDYEKMIFFQILLLALIPAVSYLIGWKFHSKTAGIAAGLLIILKEKNAIASAFKVGLANPKVLTSELPNALLLVLVTLCLLNWFRQGRDARLWPILAGGLTGLAIGVRGNSLTIIPLVLLLALLVLMKQPKFLKQWALVSLLFLLGAGAVLAPYSIDTAQKFGVPFWLDKIKNVIDRSDYTSHEPEANYRLNRPAPEASSDGFVLLTARHFLHNEITTVLILPIRWQADPLKSTLEHPIWDSVTDWDGSLTTGEKLALGANLLVLAFGIGAALHRWQITGLVPLGIHLTYNLTNAAARTSGGRYLAPTDWVLLLYFGLGISALVFAIRQWEPAPQTIEKTKMQSCSSLWLAALSLVGFLLIGSAYLLSGLIPQPYDLASAEARRSYLAAEQDRLIEAGIDPAEVTAFINTKGAVFSIGKALYPRYYQAGEKTPDSSHLPEIPSVNPRLYFLLLEDLNFRHVSIPLPEDLNPVKFPHGAYGLILGCGKEGYIEGLIFIPLDHPGSQILTQADLTLSCE